MKLFDEANELLEHFAMHGTDEQRRLAHEALKSPPAGLIECMEVVMQLMGQKDAATAFRLAFPGAEIDGPPLSETEQ